MMIEAKNPYSRLLKVLARYVIADLENPFRLLTLLNVYRMVRGVAGEVKKLPLEEHVRGGMLTIDDVFEMGYTMACIQIMHRLRKEDVAD